MNCFERALAIKAEITEYRRHIHANPEVGLKNPNTRAYVMEKLKEAYEALNPNVEIELQQSDSSSGMTSTRDGVCDIGMASRALKDSELEAGLVPMTIAMDGIAVIVSNDNEVTGLTTEQVRSIYMGETTDWSEVNE